MKIAIHHTKKTFSDRWIEYCEEQRIQYKIVDCYKSNIIQQLEDCDALMWNFHHANPKDVIFAKQLMYSVQASGKKVFPDFNTAWHFDDKVGQKYLLESIRAPLVPSFVFYKKEEAVQWAKSTDFPKVFKLRKGAAGANVRLIKTEKQALRLINKAFSKGFRIYDPWGGLKERWRKFKNGKTKFLDIAEGVGRIFIRTRFEKIAGREKGYVYFQDFVEDCGFDLRVKIVNDRCWVYKRIVRENDFRASGSGNQIFSSEGVPMEVIKLAFSLSRQLKLDSVAFDFLLSKGNEIFLLEISYSFAYTEDQHYAYWDSDMNWHEEKFNPFGWMVESVMKNDEE